MKITVSEAFVRGKEILDRAGVSSKYIDARVLLSFAAGLTQVELFTNPTHIINEDAYTKYMLLIEKRAKNEPVAYLVGTTEFMGLPFKVDSRVLIPRGDTEVLVELVLEDIKSNNRKQLQILDLCTGSGCIAVSLGRFAKDMGIDIGVTVTDISTGALELAKENAVANEVEISFAQGSLFSCLDKGLRFDYIVSNPPYIDAEEMDGLMADVKDYEPHLALYGGQDGLDFYREIACGAREFLQPEGKLFLEIGAEQGDAIEQILRYNGFRNIFIKKDYAGLPRVACGLA